MPLTFSRSDDHSSGIPSVPSFLAAVLPYQYRSCATSLALVVASSTPPILVAFKSGWL